MAVGDITTRFVRAASVSTRETFSAAEGTAHLLLSAMSGLTNYSNPNVILRGASAAEEVHLSFRLTDSSSRNFLSDRIIIHNPETDDTQPTGASDEVSLRVGPGGNNHMVYFSLIQVK